MGEPLRIERFALPPGSLSGGGHLSSTRRTRWNLGPPRAGPRYLLIGPRRRCPGKRRTISHRNGWARGSWSRTRWPGGSRASPRHAPNRVCLWVLAERRPATNKHALFCCLSIGLSNNITNLLFCVECTLGERPTCQPPGAQPTQRSAAALSARCGAARATSVPRPQPPSAHARVDPHPSSR